MADTLRLIKENAVDIIQLDNRFSMGAHGARTTAGMCEAAGIPVISHAYYQFSVSVVERLRFFSPAGLFEEATAGRRSKAAQRMCPFRPPTPIMACEAALHMGLL